MQRNNNLINCLQKHRPKPAETVWCFEIALIVAVLDNIVDIILIALSRCPCRCWKCTPKGRKTLLTQKGGRKQITAVDTYFS